MIRATAEQYAFHRGSAPTAADYKKAYEFFDKNNAKRVAMGIKPIALVDHDVPEKFRRAAK